MCSYLRKYSSTIQYGGLIYHTTVVFIAHGRETEQRDVHFDLNAVESFPTLERIVTGGCVAAALVLELADHRCYASGLAVPQQIERVGDCSWGALFDCITYTWMLWGWKPSWQWRRSTAASRSLSRLTTHRDGYHDVSNTRNGLGKARGGQAQAFCSTLSSNHLILMLLHCLVNQPSIYIKP